MNEGDRGERENRLTEFFSANELSILNAKYEKHARKLYIWISHDYVTRKEIDHIISKKRWQSSTENVETKPGAD